jgi:thiol-disulfide isomerase/thioredoxin
MRKLVAGFAVLALLAVLGWGAMYVVMTGGLTSAGPATEVGAVMPGFTLKDTTGKEYTLDQYKGKIVVLDFCSQHCPWSRGADSHLDELAKKYAGNDVVFLGIDSHFDTPVADIQKYAEDVSKGYPILKDEGNQYADKVGARVTPEIYIVDKAGKLAYHGAVDDRKDPESKGATPYVDNAISAIIAGNKPDPDRAKAWGCTIKRAS